MKKQDIIKELQTLGIDHDPTDLKEDLEDLLTAAVKAAEPVERCRQCGRPADHQHRGI